MAVTAALVKELREMTGVGMMECKKALVQSDGHIESARENLRKAGLAKADKKSGRVAAEGKIVTAISDDHHKAIMVEVNSETDFAAKETMFISFGEAVAKVALDTDTTEVDHLMAAQAPQGGTLEEARQTLVAKIGENIQVRRTSMIATENGNIGSYVHGDRIGVLVELAGGDTDLARDLAMHIAASNPQFVDESQVPADVMDKEREILAAQAKDSGKPEEIIDKMVAGRLRKYLAEITLVGQPFIKDPDLTVAKLLAKHDASVVGYQRLEVGEGIERKEENFADEVMAQVRGN